jgi:hypothetical protein
MSNGETTTTPPKTVTIPNDLGAVFDDSKRKYGLFTALKHKKFWAAIVGASVPWYIAQLTFGVSMWGGIVLVGIGSAPLLAYILGQAYVDGKEKESIARVIQ